MQAPDTELDLLTATAGSRSVTFTVRQPGFYLVTWRGNISRTSKEPDLLARLIHSGDTAITFANWDIPINKVPDLIDSTKMVFVTTANQTMSFQVLADGGNQATLTLDNGSFLIWVKLG